MLLIAPADEHGNRNEKMKSDTPWTKAILRSRLLNDGVLFLGAPYLFWFAQRSGAEETKYGIEEVLALLGDGLPSGIERSSLSRRFRRAMAPPESEEGLWKLIYGRRYRHARRLSFAKRLYKERSPLKFGAWIGVAKYAVGMRLGFRLVALSGGLDMEGGVRSDLASYMRFITALTKIERQLLSHRKDEKLVKRWLEVFLLHDCYPIEKPEDADIARVLLWASLYEMEMALSSGAKTKVNDRLPSFLLRALPRLNKKGELISSKEALLTYFRQEKGFTWERLAEEMLGGEGESIEDSVDSKSQTLRRIRKGNNPIEVEMVNRLYGAGAEGKSLDTGFVHFINIWSDVQHGLLANGVNPKSIVQRFELYEEFLKRVHAVFEDFKCHGEITGRVPSWEKESGL